MILYPWMTSNFIKHKISKDAQILNALQIQEYGNKPRFVYNQVDAYLNNPKNQEDYFKRRT